MHDGSDVGYNQSDENIKVFIDVLPEKYHFTHNLVSLAKAFMMVQI